MSFLRFEALSQPGNRWVVLNQAFYNPATFSVRDIRVRPFAALTYLGFDAVTTLAEDVKDPRRNVMLAAVGVCVFTGLFGGLLVYSGSWFGRITTHIRTLKRPSSRSRGGRRNCVVSRDGDPATGGHGRRRLDHSSRGGAASLRHGSRRSDSAPVSLICTRCAISPNYNVWVAGLLAYGGSLVIRLQRLPPGDAPTSEHF